MKIIFRWIFRDISKFHGFFTLHWWPQIRTMTRLVFGQKWSECELQWAEFALHWQTWTLGWRFIRNRFSVRNWFLAVCFFDYLLKSKKNTVQQVFFGLNYKEQRINKIKFMAGFNSEPLIFYRSTRILRQHLKKTTVEQCNHNSKMKYVLSISVYFKIFPTK